ncbi:hypothetical protein [Hyphomonas sp.]|uniref:hypothetical protein n=1 Tax=Hyphomonas sp. TaxID=87 RepID=UPI003241BBBC
MSESQFYTFITGGVSLMIAAGLLVAWHLWRMREEHQAGIVSALDGVSHELRINLQRFVSELGQVHAIQQAGPDLLLPVRHPQLDGVNASMIRANRNALAVIGNTYQELEARKMALRAALAQGRDPVDSLDDAMDATINGIATLYMWEVHGGARPSEVGRVRSWDVRDWMKGHNFTQQSLPGMYLRDEVVERLRAYGLHLTPKPLTHTAHEYYSMHYDRKADIHAPFGRRKTPEQLEEAARKAEEKAAKKAAKQAEKEARKAAKAAEKAEKEAAKQAEDEAKAAASLAAVDTVIDEGPAYADEPAEETYEEGQVFHSSHDDPSDMTDEDEDEYGMIEDAETNTRPN